MNILDTIVANKQKEVAARKKQVTVAELEKTKLFANTTLSLKSFLTDPSKTGIIAEYKRKSPSKGIINAHSGVQEITNAYVANGASGLSVLTDEVFFGGTLNDLLAVTAGEVPILRKDFMIDEFQILEAKAYGASVILLIAACLNPGQVQALAKTARSLGLEVLLEVHNEKELEHVCDEVDLIGVNNRNLKTFEVNIETSLKLIHKIPTGKPAVTESGINDINTILTLRNAGFSGFLIGERFMKEQDPAIAFADFVHQLKTKTV